MKNTTQAIVLFAHGSRQSSWREPFDRIAQHLTEQRADVRVELAFLELMTPSLNEVLSSVAAEGVIHVTIVPLFFGVGNHVARDLGELVQGFQTQQPQMQITVAPAVGQSAAVLAAMVDYASNAVPPQS